MRLSYVTTYNALDIKNWSGTGYSIGKSLENQNIDVDYIGDLELKNNFKLKLKHLIYSRVLNKEFEYNREVFVAKNYANQVQMKLKIDTDIIFSPGTIPIAFIESQKPKVFYTDATFAGMIGFYKGFSNLSKETIEHGNYIEKIALDSCQLAIYSSEWAAQTAIKNYYVNPAKIKVVPFGANFESIKVLKDIKNIINNRSKTTINLLFVGVEWERKGGDLAVEIAKKLNQLGVKSTLHIVGINNLPIDNKYDFVVNHGFVSKSNESGINHLDQLFNKCHFLLVPSIAECSAIVYCEANAYGMPVITHDVGGSSTIIRDNINGKLFQLYSHVDLWCNYILSIFIDRDAYNDFCLSSFNEYETRLNWNVAGKAITRLLNDI